MPRKKEYDRLRRRSPETYPARYHEALLKLMAGAESALVGTTQYGNLDAQRLAWCHFLSSWGEGTPMAEWVATRLIRTYRTAEPSGTALWASAKSRFGREIADQLK